MNKIKHEPRQKDDFLYYKCILEVANGSNVSVTAKKFGLSQPAISKIIIKYETELGFPIFDKKKRGDSNGWGLTLEGRVFIEKIKKILAIEEDFAAEIQNLKKKKEYNILFMPLEVKLYYDVLYDKLNSLGDFKVNIDSALAVTIEDKLLTFTNNKIYDFGLVSAPFQHEEELNYISLKSDNIFVVINKKNPLLEGHNLKNAIDITLLERSPLLLQDENYKIRALILRMYEKNKIWPNIKSNLTIHA